MLGIAQQAQGICIVEQVIGALFVAILIAGLAGAYLSQRRGTG